MKKRCFVAVITAGMLFVGGCSSNNESKDATSYYNAYEKIDKTAMMDLSSVVDVDLNYGDAKVMYETAEQVAIVRVDSIDGGSNYNEQTGEYIYPYTFGKMTVLQVMKGDLTVDHQVNYIRMGGIVTFDEYYQGLYPAEQKKLDANMQEKPTYVKQMFGDDIDIEAGKTYLMYIGEGDAADFPLAKKDAYPIIGWEGGLREINGNVNARSGITVLNNITGEWESLQDVVPE